MGRKIKEIELSNICVTGKFWKNYMELVREKIIPYQWKALNDKIEGAAPSGCIRNFRVAAGMEKGTFTGMVFQDSDVYKWLEAVAYSLAWHPDPELESLADETILLIASAQQPDGYLDTYYIIHGLENRFTNVMSNHEMYCLGHMTEAAVAYYEITGKRLFMDVAIRYARCIAQHFGQEEGKLRGYPGHEVAEMALVRLYRATGDEAHLKLAKYMIDERGKEPLYFDEERKRNHNNFKWEDSSFRFQYYQAGKPVRQQEKAEGHAVRAVYLYSGMADVAGETEDKELFAACEKLWNNIVNKQMYITGGIGSSQYGEAFTFDYDLPNDTAYAETCASVGLVFFAKRMFELTGDGKYIDVMERAVYNGTISGVSLDGTEFFYVNPLEVLPEASEKDYNKRHVKIQRQKWFGCACCPPNLARMVSFIGGYSYGQKDDTVYVNLYSAGSIKVLKNEVWQQIDITTDYPWIGEIKAVVHNEQKSLYKLALRIPGWCEAYSVKINGELISRANLVCEKRYLYLNRQWKDGDMVELYLDMPVKLISANSHVRDDVGKAAVVCGPMVYCLEEEDNGDQLQRIYLNENAVFSVSYESDMLNGINVIKTKGRVLLEKNTNDLYYTYQKPQFAEKELVFIPYFSWGNRRAGEMTVWVKI